MRPICPLCPLCQSERIRSRDLGKRVGSFVDAVAGAVKCAANVLKSTDARVNPTAHAVGALAGAVMSCLVGATADCTTGAFLGKVFDEKALNNFWCLDCGCTFQRCSF